MKLQFKSVSIGILIGAFVSFVPPVLSISTTDSVNGTQLLKQMIDNSTREAIEEERRREEELLDQLPDVVECDKLQWMTSCDLINRQAKKNPSAHLRIRNKDGVEFNFQPGTPSAVIRLQLEETPEAADAYIEYMGRTMGAYKNVAEVYGKQLAVHGGIENVRTYDQMQMDKTRVPKLPNDKVKISVFIESTCNACEIMLRNLKAFQLRHPNTAFSVYMVDNSPRAFRDKVINNGFSGRILKPDEVRKVIQKGTPGWPAIWLDNKAFGARDILIGVKTVSMLETRITSMGLLANKMERNQ